MPSKRAHTFRCAPFLTAVLPVQAQDTCATTGRKDHRAPASPPRPPTHPKRHRASPSPPETTDHSPGIPRGSRAAPKQDREKTVRINRMQPLTPENTAPARIKTKGNSSSGRKTDSPFQTTAGPSTNAKSRPLPVVRPSPPPEKLCPIAKKSPRDFNAKIASPR